VLSLPSQLLKQNDFIQFVTVDQSNPDQNKTTNPQSLSFVDKKYGFVLNYKPMNIKKGAKKSPLLVKLLDRYSAIAKK